MAKHFIDARKIHYFGSGTKNKALSNFTKIENNEGIYVQGHYYPTSEHAFQALDKVHADDRHRLAVGGDLSVIEAFALFCSEPAKKIKFWGAKQSSPEMTGIVAKMIVNPKHNKKLSTPLRIETRDRQETSDAAMKVLFLEILVAKFKASQVYRDAILSVPLDIQLIEFNGRAQFETVQKGRPPRWSGMVKNGILYGDNLQGNIQSEIRSMAINNVI